MLGEVQQRDDFRREAGQLCFTLAGSTVTPQPSFDAMPSSCGLERWKCSVQRAHVLFQCVCVCAYHIVRCILVLCITRIDTRLVRPCSLAARKPQRTPTVTCADPEGVAEGHSLELL